MTPIVSMLGVRLEVEARLKKLRRVMKEVSPTS